jgi:hypothetical protein
MLAASRHLAHRECETMSFITNPGHVAALLLATVMLLTCTSTQAQLTTGDEILNTRSFAPIHKQIRPQRAFAFPCDGTIDISTNNTVAMRLMETSTPQI